MMLHSTIDYLHLYAEDGVQKEHYTLVTHHWHHVSLVTVVSSKPVVIYQEW